MKTLDFTVPGFLFSGVTAGIKKDGKRDLGLIYSEVPAAVAGLFTSNAVKAAPVVLDRERVKGGTARAVVINSGCANACTGARGRRDALKMTSFVARRLKVDEKEVFVSSTGVIGVPLPMKKIDGAIPDLVGSLSAEGWMQTVEAIMTTDTFPKVEVATCRVRGAEVKLCGMVKGAGMIHPNMATMLCYLVTDAAIRPPLLRRMLREAVDASFNRITIDGDTSTNDTVLLLANGRAGHPPLSKMDGEAESFQAALLKVCRDLARNLVRGGEGVTKLVDVVVKGGRHREDAKKVAYAIAHSPLVKTAFFGEDCNWGRILCAAGYSGAKVDPDRIDLFFDKCPVVKKGMTVGHAGEATAAKVLKNPAFKVTVDLHQGKGEFSVLTCDLSLEYVKINGSYRS